MTTVPSTSASHDADVRDVIIVGSGPAGYTAAVYAARANLAPLVFEGSVTAGGALMTTTEVENFPGFRDGIMGPELMDNMRAQAERFGAELVADDVTAMSLEGDVKTVTDGAGAVHRARAVILAMGSGYRKLGIPDEDRLSGHGVSWCATCDGFFFRDQHIAVVGGGDSAVEEATFLSRFASKVTLVHRRGELRASKIMQERAFADPKIEFAWNSAVDAIHGEDKLTGVTLVDTETGEKRALDVTGLFIAIGHDPRSELLPGQVDLDEDGYVLVDQPSTRTSLPGVFARATWSTTTTARRSPRPAPAARRRSTPSATWPPSTTSPRPPARRTPPRRRRPPRPPAPTRSSNRSRPPGPEPEPPGGPEETSHGPLFDETAPTDQHQTTRRTRGRHADRDRRRLRDHRPQVRQARPRGLLGGVVRSVPSGRPDPRRDQGAARRQDHVRQDERRREPGDPRHATA